MEIVKLFFGICLGFIIAAIVGVACAFLTYMLQMMMEQGHILRRYRVWLDCFIYDRFPMLYKPLGACIFCMNFWVTVIGAAFFWGLLGRWEEGRVLFYLLFTLVFSQFIIKKIY